MSNILFENLFISVGIDVGADFSWMSIALPNQTFVGKPFKLLHSDLNSLSLAVSKIKEAEELYSLESRIFLESTGIYHYPLFCYLRDKGFNCSVINPIITKNSTNINIRKVHNDRFDSRKAALVGLKPDLKVSLIPSDLALDLRNLSRAYYDLMDNRSAYVNKLQGELRMVFPQYLKIFSKITTITSLTLLEKYTSPEAFLNAPQNEIIDSIRGTARFGLTYATNKYNAIIQAAKDANTFGYSISSNFKRIRLYIRFIKSYDDEISSILSDMHDLVDANDSTVFVKQIHLIESYKGAGFLSAVKQSGKFEGTKISMSKRGSRIARRVLHSMALVSISKNRNGSPTNPVLRDYYLKKCQSKPKMVALGAVMHKVCNIVYAILRDKKEFTIITPDEHQTNYLKAQCDKAA